MRKIIAGFLLPFAFLASSAHADYNAGLAAANKSDFVTALKEWRPLAEQGAFAAQFNLGLLYYTGRGVPQDYKEALKWYRLAADQGYAQAQLNLGLMYAQAQGVPKDFVEAVKWYRLAADQGYANAQYNLGLQYDLGEGVPQDYKAAVKWYRLAADQGYVHAQFNLGLMSYHGQGVPQDYKDAVEWFRLAARQGNTKAQANLGAMHADGKGVPESRVVAYALYNLSAANDPSSDNKATGNRTALAKTMTTREIGAGQDLTKKMAAPGNLLNALDQYMKYPTVKEAVKRASSSQDAPLPVASNVSYPARPAKVPGVTSCNTRCNNASCYRTYDNGRKAHFIAKQKWNPFKNQFEFDSGSC